MAVSVDSGSVREVIGLGTDFVYLSGPSPSPDGNRLMAAQCRYGPSPCYSRLMVVPTAAGSEDEPVILACGALAAWSAGWSTDGGYAAYRLYTGGVEQAHIVNLSTGAKVRLGEALFVSESGCFFFTDDGVGFHVPWMRNGTLVKIRLTRP